VADFERVSWAKYSEILNALTDITRGHHFGSFRMRSLDEDEKKRDIINLLIKNSTIKGSIGDTSIYVIPIYFYDSSSGYGHAIIATLTITKDQSEYIIEASYHHSSLPETSGREELEKLVDEEIGSLARLLKKTISSKNPNALKLVDIIGYGFCEKEIKTINFLEKIYGDEILNDDTIPGIHSVCFLKNDFFANDKVIVIPYINLWVVRDKDSGRIFIYDYAEAKFREVSPEEKIFYDALFIGFRDLLKPEAVVEDKWSYGYSVSSTEVEVGGKRVSLVAVGTYDPEKKNWRQLSDVFAITCDNRCSIYPFWEKHVINDIHEMEKNIYFVGIKEALINYILLSKEIQRRAREWMTKELTKKHTWEILPA
jgi:hypothetical protein